MNLTSSGGGSVTIGTPTVQSWDNNSGGVFSFAVTAQTPGTFTLTATDTLYAASSDSGSNSVNLAPHLALQQWHSGAGGRHLYGTGRDAH